MLALNFFFILFGVVAYACELRSYTLTGCVVTAEFEGGTQFSCDKGLAYCCETFNVTASKAQTWFGCTGGVATSIKNYGIRAGYIAKFYSADGFIGCPYSNDFYGRMSNNGTASTIYSADTGYGDFSENPSTESTDADVTAFMTSQLCDYEVSGFEVTPI